MSEKSEKVITRFAPSPTGFMHVGGVRTALYAWLLAKKNKGIFILRIEDTDKEREVPNSIEHIKESLKWLSLDWDEGPDIGGPNGPYTQSERLEIYKRYAEKLIEKGLAYADPYSDEEIDSFRKKAEEEKRPFLYRNHRPEKFEIWDGTRPLRFKIENIKETKWQDLSWGELSAGEEALDDFILIKSDGFPTYNFAHIVDDIEMGVTHVVRGQEFISSTPKFLAVYKALDIDPPSFVTTPPIMSLDGKKKLGKRDGAKDILEYRKEGYLPEAMINYLAFLGWNPGDDREVMKVEEIIEAFDVSKIQRSGAKWSDEKLLWFNKEFLKNMEIGERSEKIKEELLKNPKISTNQKIQDKDYISKIIPIIFDHISKWSDIQSFVEEGEMDYFLLEPTYDFSKLNWKEVPSEETKEHLINVLNTLNSAPLDKFDTIDDIKNLIFSYATEKGKGNVLWPVRMALSGKDKSPDPFTLIYILGKEETVRRLNKAIENL